MNLERKKIIEQQYDKAIKASIGDHNPLEDLTLEELLKVKLENYVYEKRRAAEQGITFPEWMLSDEMESLLQKSPSETSPIEERP